MFTPNGQAVSSRNPHDLAAHGVEFPGRGLDDPQRPGIGDRRSERRSSDPAHGRLDDGRLDAEQARDAVVEGS